MMMMPLSADEYRDLKDKTLRTDFLGKPIVLARSMSPGAATSFHGTDDKLTVFVGAADMAALERDKWVNLNLWGRVIRLEVPK